MCSKAMHDPLADAVPRVVPIVAQQFMNRLKVVDVCTILEENELSTDEVVDRYPEICRTI